MRTSSVCCLFVVGLIACKAPPKNDPPTPDEPKPAASTKHTASAQPAGWKPTPLNIETATKEYDDIVGDPKLAKELVDFVIEASSFYGIFDQTGHTLLKSLLKAGLHVTDAKKMFSAMTDIGVMKSWPDAYSTVHAYETVHKRGYASDKDIDALADVLPRPTMLFGLGKALGIDATTPTGQQAVEQSIQALKVKPRDFAAGIVVAVMKRFDTKAVGEAALAKKSATAGGDAG